MSREITRRRFLEGAAGVAALSLLQLHCDDGGERTAKRGGTATRPTRIVEYRGFEDLYRQRWTWDRVAKGTHFVNCWYQRGCNWNVYVKDGIVFREEQASTYEQTNADVPDYNPRGCQKGACYSERMYDATRLRHPLVRVGERGEGRWKRIAWSDAIRAVADATVDVLTSDGPEALVWDQGTAQTSGGTGLGTTRTSHLLDSLVLDVNAEIGDHHPGAGVTCGKISFSSSADDLFHSDLILIWGGNPASTQIPNAHFINEARYHGARVVTITPDYNPSAMHADEWIAVEVASDAAFGLSLAQVMIDEAIFDSDFVKEQTDLTLLVRLDDGRQLRSRDLADREGDDDTFFVFDRASQSIREAPKESLTLDGLDPALEGEFSVETRDGEVRVKPAFAVLRERLAGYTPEKAEATTGVAPASARKLAREIARARAATCITQSNFSKFYHGVEMERAQILVFALAGQMGRKGAGFMGFPYLFLDNSEPLSMISGSLPPALALKALQLKALPDALKMMMKGYTQEMIVFEMARQHYKKGGFPSTILLLHQHGGLDEFYGASQRWDPFMKRDLKSFLDEALKKGWQFAPKRAPRILFEVGGNVLRRVRGYQKMVDEMLPRLDLLVTVDWRMSNTALYSDYVFPAASWYEKDDITWATPIAPFAQVVTKAAEPIADTKSDWEFHCLLMKEVEQRAAARGVEGFVDREGQKRHFAGLYDEFTFGGRFGEHDQEALLDFILGLTSNLSGIGWQELKEKGFERFTDLGSGYLNIGNATDIAAGDTITANTWHTEKKQPWPTLTRRMQFYIDHDFYLELGEELPVHKDNPAVGGDYPLQMTGAHTRWSIHSSWRDQKHMQQLNRGEPLVLIGTLDAAGRGIADGDRVRVYNDIDSTELMAKISPALRPGQLIVYHAWEPFQFKGRKSHAALTPSPINPIQLAGGHFHLQPRPAFGSPGSTDRATRVEVERIAATA